MQIKFYKSYAAANDKMTVILNVSLYTKVYKLYNVSGIIYHGYPPANSREYISLTVGQTMVKIQLIPPYQL